MVSSILWNMKQAEYVHSDAHKIVQNKHLARPSSILLKSGKQGRTYIYIYRHVYDCDYVIMTGYCIYAITVSDWSSIVISRNFLLAKLIRRQATEGISIQMAQMDVLATRVTRQGQHTRRTCTCSARAGSFFRCGGSPPHQVGDALHILEQQVLLHQVLLEGHGKVGHWLFS